MNFQFWKRLVSVIGVSIIVVCLVVVATNVSIHLSTKGNIFNEIAELPEAGTVLIPGAAVSGDGVLSPIFVDRIDTAVELYKAKKVSKILVSGDNSEVYYNEVNPVRTYLLEQGIPDGDIFLDHAGFDTYSSMYRAKEIFEVTTLIISTQSFHLPRAVFIARALGLEASGINADKGNILTKNYIREIFANEKALLDVVLQREPKYLGERIPVTEDARDFR